MSLNNVATRLSDLGRREEALAAIEEAVAIRRELAVLRPDAFRPDLATSLNNVANRLSDLGRREEALAAIEEAVAIYRELACAAARRVPPGPGPIPRCAGKLSRGDGQSRSSYRLATAKRSRRCRHTCNGGRTATPV